MAKLKKTARTSTGSTGKARPASGAAQAERLGKSITESAQQIWLAGMGAFAKAQAEGLSLERNARKFAGARADEVRDAMEDKVGQARERAADTWDKLEKVFEDRVQRALVKLGVPSREDLNALSTRVERLTAELRKANAAGPASAKPTKAARKAPAKTAARKAPARRAPKPKPAAGTAD